MDGRAIAQTDDKGDLIFQQGDDRIAFLECPPTLVIGSIPILYG